PPPPPAPAPPAKPKAWEPSVHLGLGVGWRPDADVAHRMIFSSGGDVGSRQPGVGLLPPVDGGGAPSGVVPAGAGDGAVSRVHPGAIRFLRCPDGGGARLAGEIGRAHV